MKGVLDVGGCTWMPPKTGGIRFVLCEKQLGCALALQRVTAKLRVRRVNLVVVDRAQDRFLLALFPGPCVSEPKRRKQMDLRGLGTAVVDRDADQRVFRVSLGIFHKDIEIPILVKHACVEKFVLKLFS